MVGKISHRVGFLNAIGMTELQNNTKHWQCLFARGQSAPITITTGNDRGAAKGDGPQSCEDA